VRTVAELKPDLELVDPQVCGLLEQELQRQEDTLELIPSENLASPAVLEALGSWLNNKYAEGTPGKRYYGGCQVVDQVENLARERACALFGSEYANVQPHCGSSANMAVYAATLEPGDSVLGMGLDDGGHLTHGSPVNFSGKLYRFSSYAVDPETELLDMEQVRSRAQEVRPKMIVAGYSAYSRILDFASFRQIADEVGALLLVDMAHFAGLVAGKAHPSPVPYADFVTLTTHKTMRGPWGGMILCKERYGAAIDKAVCPGIQGGPLLHAIAAKAVMLAQCASPDFERYAAAVVSNAKELSSSLLSGGARLVSGGTDNHLMVMDLRPFGVGGREAQRYLDSLGVTANPNSFRNHGGSPFNPNGLRMGSPSVTSRGMGKPEMTLIAEIVLDAITHAGDEETRLRLRQRTLELCHKFPLPYRGV